MLYFNNACRNKVRRDEQLASFACVLLPAASSMLEAASIHLQQRGRAAAVVSTFLEGSVVGVVLPLFSSFVSRVAKSGDFPKTMDTFKAQLPTVLRRLGRILSHFSPAECEQTVQVVAAEGKTEKVILHETSHPYEHNNKHFRVHIPGCQSLALKFDRRCCIRDKDRLVVSWTHKADQADEQPTIFEFSGRFFSSETDDRERTVHGDTVTIDFSCQPAVPVPPPDGAPKNGSVTSVEADGDIKTEANHRRGNAASIASTLVSAASLSATALKTSASENGENHEAHGRVPISTCDEEDASVAATNSVPAIAQVTGVTHLYSPFFCFNYCSLVLRRMQFFDAVSKSYITCDIAPP